MSMQDLLPYWPSPQAVLDCLKIDAESSSEAVSLAVHQPMRFERRRFDSDANQFDMCGEHELLQAFLEPNLADGRVILPIVGTTGVGKSHVVRWLKSQISGLPDPKRRVVILIPKGISFKGVLRLLLEQLTGPKYDGYRKELLRAQEALDPKEAAGLLCEMLAHTLTTMYETALQTLRTNTGDNEAREREAMCRPDMLPTLLRNQALRDRYFVRNGKGDAGVISRLVEPLTVERSPGTEDDRKHIFVADDLLFEGVDQDGLGRAEIRAINQLEAHEDRRKMATRLLNEALDDAKQRLVRLDPTIVDLFDAIRATLLTEKKELILLVEDFVVLSGLQKQLLQVMIKEAIRGGRQVLCTIRTALAYTTGYLNNAATVLSRAGLEYRIPDDSGSEEELSGRITRLVGAYLNAARLGQDRLNEAYRDRRASSTDLRGWIPVFRVDTEPDVSRTLEAFGQSEDQYELFPFNANAIRELARDGCVISGQLVYNPRRVIQNVLQLVLRNRDLFEAGSFPSDEFGASDRRLPSRMIEHLKRQVPQPLIARYIRFLIYWGGEPNDASELERTNERVFSAFGLTKGKLAAGAAQAAQQSPSLPRVSTPAPEPSKPSTVSTHPDITKWEALLERWRGGDALAQTDANALRKWIADGLQGSIDWDWHLLKTLKEDNLDTWSRWIYIPRAAGNEGRSAEESMAAICTEQELNSELDSARILGALMAVVQFHGIYKGTWDFDGAEDCLPRYTAFMQSLSESARLFVQQRYCRQVWDPVPSLVQGLLIGARALGIEGAARDTPHTLIKAMLEPAPPEEQGGASTDPTDATGWTEFTQILRQSRSKVAREGQQYLSWRDHLLHRVGARQGGGPTVHAIDVLRLKPVIEKAMETWTLDAVTGSPINSFEFPSLRSTAREIRDRSAAIEVARKRLLTWRGQMLEWLGNDFDKTTFMAEFSGLLEAISDAGLGAGLEISTCHKVLDAFRNVPVKEALNDIQRLADDVTLGGVLALLAKGYHSYIPKCEEMMDRSQRVLEEIELRIQGEFAKHGDNPREDAVTVLTQELHNTAKLLEEA